jgi:hypothetical protein
MGLPATVGGPFCFIDRFTETSMAPINAALLLPALLLIANVAWSAGQQPEPGTVLWTNPLETDSDLATSDGRARSRRAGC